MRSWTHAEEEALRYLSHLGARACSEAFERSIQSVQRKALRLGVSLRRKKSGYVLDISGEAVLRRIRELSEASMCPGCGFRFAGVKSTGLCGICHVKRLKAVHEDEIVKIEAQRELWAVRSRLQRRRRELEAVES